MSIANTPTIAIFPLMQVILTPELEQLVHRKIDTGRYLSASEVVGDALRLMDRCDQLQDAQKAGIAEKIAAGVASLRAGNGADGEAVFDRLEAELDASERQGTA